MRAPSSPLAALALVVVAACEGGGAAAKDDAGLTDDPCDDESLVFCADRVDDDCDGADEPCPSTQPGDVAPTWSCEGEPPSSVLAFARFGENAQVAGGCVVVYQGESGAFYAAVTVLDGPAPRGPDGETTERCAFETAARRHAFFTASPVFDCPPLVYAYPGQPQGQLLSSACRKMVRNIRVDDPRYDPDIQFLPGDRADQEARLAAFDVAEVACIGLVGPDGEPARADQDFVTQSEAPLTLSAGFIPR